MEREKEEAEWLINDNLLKNGHSSIFYYCTNIDLHYIIRLIEIALLRAQ